MADIVSIVSDAPRTVSILGSTGSVGCNTLDLIAANSGSFDVSVLTANQNVDLLVKQAKQFNPVLAVIGDDRYYQKLKSALSGTGIRVAAGASGLIEAAQYPTDWLMAGIVGAVGLRPTLEAVRRGSTVALANKECLVCAGDIFMAEVKTYGATLLPVDSEHNAVYQVFNFARPELVESITLTASGGPFYRMTADDMRHVTPEQAVNHPNWDMGRKISVDSATLMNKGLEVIEAYHLFPVTVEQIKVVIHPQSVVHSMVNYVDGSVLAQMGNPDMRTPISYTLNWPERLANTTKQLDLAEIGVLEFIAPDYDQFPCLRIAREALQSGGANPTILNAANEVAVEEFLKGSIAFLVIPEIVEKVLEQMDESPPETLDDVGEIDRRARALAASLTTRT